MPRNAADFLSIYQQGFVRVAACRPVCRIADPAFNLEQTLRLAREGDEAGIALMGFPELGLSGYSIAGSGRAGSCRPFSPAKVSCMARNTASDGSSSGPFEAGGRGL